MKLPSLEFLYQSATQSLKRFPLPLASSIFGAVVAILWIEPNSFHNVYPNLLLAAAIGIPIFFCASIFSEHKKFSIARTLLINLIAVGSLVLIYFSFPNDSDVNAAKPYIRYGAMNVIVHLLASFLPFAASGSLNGFWQYNRILFVRFCAALLYSGFLYAGLAIAVSVINFLFKLNIDERIYAELFAAVAGVFNTWFFLAGVPTSFDELENITEYPRGLKIFTQFILLPLLALYLVILYAYSLKVIGTWDWPEGYFAYLVISISVLGIFTLLLIHPYQKLSGNEWIRRFSRIYYFILFPLVIMLFIAIGFRLNQYGITINRYIILALGIWLTIVCTYFAVGKTNIKFVPISLTIAVLIASFGPWSMFAVSERNQVAKLKTMLEHYGILRDGKIQREEHWSIDTTEHVLMAKAEDTNSGVLPDSIHNEVKSILEYLDDFHGTHTIDGWYAQNLDSLRLAINAHKGRYDHTDMDELYMRSMGLSFAYKYKDDDNSEILHFETDDPWAIPVSTFDYLLYAKCYTDETDTVGSFAVDDATYTLLNLNNNRVLLIGDNDTLMFSLHDKAEALAKKYAGNDMDSVAPLDMTFIAENKKLYAKFEATSLNVNKSDSAMNVTFVMGNLLVRAKQKH